MKNVLKFHLADLRALFTHPFVLIIAVAACVIPALYAWFNIYSNWDPYGATGNIPIALCSEDEGWTDPAGGWVAQGQQIVEELAASDSIRWIVVDSAAEAEEGVRAGRYYAGLVLGRHLSRNMYDVTAALSDKEPSVIFYENVKTNAVASKIAEAAADAVEHDIQSRCLAVLLEIGFTEIGELLAQADAENAVDSLTLILTDLRDGLDEYADTASALADGAGRLSQQLDGADLPQLSGGDDLSAGAAAAEALRQTLLPEISAFRDGLTGLNDTLAGLAAGESLTEELQRGLLAQTDSLLARVQALQELLPRRGLASAAAYRALSRLADKLSAFRELAAGAELTPEGLDLLREEGQQVLSDMESLLDDSLLPGLEQLFDGLSREIGLLQKVLDSLSAESRELQPALAAAASALSTLGSGTDHLSDLLRSCSGGVDELLAELSQSPGQELLDTLTGLLHGDPVQLASFLISPVEAASTTIYPVDNYGSAMAPFYSTLAIWVGCVVLAAVLRVSGRHPELPEVSENQSLWGRFLLFFWLSQIQATVITLGDVWLLHVQCLHLFRFWLCGAVISLVFVTLIYGLVLAFGDIGKAVVVVVMILQIAGSGGTFPIEILPDIFSRIYLFFPYPYAINAMREALFGLYGHNMAVYLAQLSVFAGVGLLAWLGIRRPNAGLLRFMEEEMEETGVL